MVLFITRDQSFGGWDSFLYQQGIRQGYYLSTVREGLSVT